MELEVVEEALGDQGASESTALGDELSVQFAEVGDGDGFGLGRPGDPGDLCFRLGDPFTERDGGRPGQVDVAGEADVGLASVGELPLGLLALDFQLGAGGEGGTQEDPFQGVRICGEGCQLCGDLT